MTNPIAPVVVPAKSDATTTTPNRFLALAIGSGATLGMSVFIAFIVSQDASLGIFNWPVFGYCSQAGLLVIAVLTLRQDRNAAMEQTIAQRDLAVEQRNLVLAQQTASSALNDSAATMSRLLETQFDQQMRETVGTEIQVIHKAYQNFLSVVRISNDPNREIKNGMFARALERGNDVLNLYKEKLQAHATNTSEPELKKLRLKLANAITNYQLACDIALPHINHHTV